MKLHRLLQNPTRLIIAAHLATACFIPVISFLSNTTIHSIDFFVFAVFFLSSSTLLFGALRYEQHISLIWKAILPVDFFSIFALVYTHHHLQSDFYYFFIWCIAEAAFIFSWRSGMAISFFSAIAYASALLFFSRISLLNLIVLRTILFFISALPVVYASYMIEVWKTSNDSKEELLVEKERLLQEKEKLVKDLELITQQMTDYTFDIQNLAVMDRLTQLYNQTYYHNRLMVEIEKSRQSKAPLSIALFDIDNFKRFNDTFGHACGDEVLKIVSSAILSKFHKRYGFAARIGGEELVIVMPETNTDDAYALAKDICDHISTLTYTFHGTTNLNMKITVSGGISTFPTMADDATSLTKCADFAMYEAKACGKNQIIRYDRINQSAILMSLATEKVDMKSTPHHIQS